MAAEPVPADIAAAINALEEWFREDGTGSSDYGSTRAALDAAILTHLRKADELKAALERIEAGT